MKKIFFVYILIIPTIVFGQKDSLQLFEPMQIKADIDTLIYKLIDVHPTFLTHYKTNNTKSKVDSIKTPSIIQCLSWTYLGLCNPLLLSMGIHP
jgi:hypothetical protein